MITDIGMLPEKVVYEYDYHECNKKDIESIVKKTIIEPAVGTGNFSSTILYHRLRLAQHYANLTGIDVKELIKTVLHNTYAFDIDAGNLEVTIRRLVDGYPDGLNSEETISYWCDHIESSIGESANKEDIRRIVTESLNLAQENWATHLYGDGVITTLCKEHNIEYDDSFIEECYDIARGNIKLFDGITECSTDTMPGYESIWWDFWEDGVLTETVNMKVQISLGRIKENNDELKALEEKSCVDGVWTDNKDKREYSKITREKAKLERIVKDFSSQDK